MTKRKRVRRVKAISKRKRVRRIKKKGGVWGVVVLESDTEIVEQEI